MRLAPSSACYGGTDVMERPCAMARGKDINKEERRRQEEGRWNGGRGEGSRSDCWWKGSRGLGDRRMRRMEACYGGAGVMERPCALARGKDINSTHPHAFSRCRSQTCVCASNGSLPHPTGYVSPPVLCSTRIAKSTTAPAQPSFNITGHNMHVKKAQPFISTPPRH